MTAKPGTGARGVVGAGTGGTGAGVTGGDLGGPAGTDSRSRNPRRKGKWHPLVDQVCARPHRQSAWQRVRASGAGPGADGLTIERFAEGGEPPLQQLSQELRAKTYRPQPVRRVFIPKSGGGQRPL